LNEEIRNLAEQAIKDQKEIFGNILFQKIEVVPLIYKKDTDAKPGLVSEPMQTQTDKSLFMEDWKKAEKLDDLLTLIKDCTKCELSKTRNKFVFGVGNLNADAMLIGEAPGADEDAQGEPFVGRAGKLLNDILKAINFRREEVYIGNILKCRPPSNRDPQPLEMETCMPYLYKQIELIKPKVILCLGRIAGAGLLNKKLSLTQMRGNVFEVQGVKTMVTYHPAALLRNPNWKKGCWEDVQKFRKLYDELTGSDNG
jgi:DNA polymerase